MPLLAFSLICLLVAFALKISAAREKPESSNSVSTSTCEHPPTSKEQQTTVLASEELQTMLSTPPMLSTYEELKTALPKEQVPSMPSTYDEHQVTSKNLVQPNFDSCSIYDLIIFPDEHFDSFLNNLPIGDESR